LSGIPQTPVVPGSEGERIQQEMNRGNVQRQFNQFAANVPGTTLADLAVAFKAQEEALPKTDSTISSLQKGGSAFGVDASGNVVALGSTFDPKKGAWVLSTSPAVEGVTILNSGETPEQRKAREIATNKQKAMDAADIKARTEPIIVSSTTTAKLNAEANANPEERETKRLEFQQKKEQREADISAAVAKGEDLIAIIDKISNTPGMVDALTGLRGRFPALTTAGVDSDAAFNQLNGLLTLENMGVMKGVLSDSDMKIIKAASSGLVPGMSKGEFMGRIRTIRAKVETALMKNKAKTGGATPQPKTVENPGSGGIKFLGFE